MLKLFTAYISNTRIDAYEAKRVAENQQAYQKQWDYEVAKIRAEKWNGVEVSNQSIYVPNTYDLKSGK